MAKQAAKDFKDCMQKIKDEQEMNELILVVPSTSLVGSLNGRKAQNS